MTPDLLETVKKSRPDMHYRWVDGFDGDPKDWDRIEAILATKGWTAS